VGGAGGIRSVSLRHTGLRVALALVLGGLALAPPAFATYPAQTGLIVFAADTGAGYQLYTLHPNGHQLRQITAGPGEATNPDWSPDGQRIAFEHSWDSDAQCATVDLIDPDGSNRVSLTTGVGGCEGQPSFAPDGSEIFYDHFDLTTLDSAIWAMNVNGENQRRIIGPWPNGQGSATDPNVSPDRKTLSFVGFNGHLFGPTGEPAQGLFSSGLDGNNLTQLMPFALDLAGKHDWAPDGRHLLVGTNANFFDPADSANIATIRPDGTKLKYLTHYHDPAVNAFAGSYSPDGKYIVFRVEDHRRYALMQMRRDGSHLKQILPFSDFRPRGSDWGPRGRDDD
jgi:Tol biopolymer transport system component